MKDQGKIIAALLIGAAAGAALGLLLAPDSGAGLREDIADYIGDLIDTAKEKAEATASSLKDYGTDVLEKSKSKVRSAVDDLNDYKDGVVDTAKSKVKGSADDLNSTIQSA